MCGNITSRFSLEIARPMFNVCPLNKCKLNILITWLASLCVLIVTNANPLDSPLLWSLITSTDVTLPAWANNVFRSSCVVDLDRFPTYSLASIFSFTFSSNLHAGIENAANPVIGLAAKTLHESSYPIQLQGAKKRSGLGCLRCRQPGVKLFKDLHQSCAIIGLHRP